jgi:hypothetical protein
MMKKAQHKNKNPPFNGRVEDVTLDLRELATAPRTTARDDGAAAGRAHAGAKAQFASARALFRLVSAFHLNPLVFRLGWKGLRRFAAQYLRG